MRYDFSKMDADSFELMIRSLNMKIFGVKCDQYGLGPDGQREFVFHGEVTDMAGIVFKGRTIGQVKYKYPVTKEDDYQWLEKEIENELERFKGKEKEYIPDNYLFYTNIVLTPMKDKGIKDRIEKYLKENNHIIPHFYVRGYDEICALLDNNRDVAICYASHILPGDVLVNALRDSTHDYSSIMQKYLARELEEDMYTRLEQAGSVTEKKISIEKVCVDIDVTDREEKRSLKFAEMVLALGNKVIGYRKKEQNRMSEEPFRLQRNENFVLIGGPGRGKTTICQFIAQIYRANYLCVTKYNDYYSKAFSEEIERSYGYEINCRRIPFKITLKEYAAWMKRQNEDDDISIVQYIRSKIKKLEGEELPITAIRQMLEQLAWIFFFDGLDEVPESSNRGEVLRQIELFINTELREASCDCMVIGTTRMQGYNNDFGEERYKHMEVAELSKEDCRKYVKKLFDVMEEQTDKREEYLEIMQEALEDETTSRLMKTPLQATIISILVKSGGKPPHERYSLFKQYYDTMVKREKQKGIIATLNANTDWLEELHLEIADRLQRESEFTDNPSAEISSEELENTIFAYIDKNKDEFYEKDDELTQKAKDFLNIITQRICFLCENRDGFYSFSIRTMQEYFAGTYIVKGVLDKDIIENISKIAYKAYWRNVLLFALGYIELEKKALEAVVSNLCYDMNGRDNLVKEEYVSDNVCLFGSWLAVDILAEDIFKGTKQNKYIELAARAVEIYECTGFTKFNLITGVQCDKLKGYVKEHYQTKKKCLDGVLALYMKLSENEKNDMEQSVDGLLEVCTEEERIRFCIRLLEEGIGFTPNAMENWKKLLFNCIREGKVKQELSAKVLSLLEQSFRDTDELALKQFWIIQCLFCAEFRYKNQSPVPEMDKRLFQNISRWLNGDKYNSRCSKTVVEDAFELQLEKEMPDAESLKCFREAMQKVQLQYLVKLCDYALEPSYSRYVEMLDILSEVDEYIAARIKKTVFGNRKRMSETEYTREQECREEARKLFAEDKTHALMKLSYCPGVSFLVVHREKVFDDALESGAFPTATICELEDKFLKGCMLMARVQASYYCDANEIPEQTVGYLLTILEEMQRRQRYYYQTCGIAALLIASDYRKELYRRVPEFYVDESVMDTEIKGRSLGEAFKFIDKEVANTVILRVVQRIIARQEEDNYLQLVLRLLECTPVPAEYISDYDLKELQKVPLTNARNKLVVLLLAMCKGENDDVQGLIKDLFELPIPRKVIFTTVVHILMSCVVKNFEKLMVAFYLLLEQETFEESAELRELLLNQMYEDKCNIK